MDAEYLEIGERAAVGAVRRAPQLSAPSSSTSARTTPFEHAA
jgi:hypothetical protein